MWDHKLFELFTNIIPQSFIFVLLFFALTGIKIEKKSFILFSVGLAFIPFLIRPYVNFGVHSIIMLLIYIIMGVMWGKVNVVSSAVYGIITFATAYFCEWITFVFLGVINFNMEQLNTDPQIRAIIGFIPLYLFFSIGILVYYIKKDIKRKEENKNDVVSEDIK